MSKFCNEMKCEAEFQAIKRVQRFHFGSVFFHALINIMIVHS